MAFLAGGLALLVAASFALAAIVCGAGALLFAIVHISKWLRMPSALSEGTEGDEVVRIELLASNGKQLGGRIKHDARPPRKEHISRN